MRNITPPELKEWLDSDRSDPLILDIREVWEYQRSHIEDSQLVPMQTVPARMFELDRTRDIVVMCHHGVRSRFLVQFLEQQGFNNLYNLAGGIDAWSKEVDPSVPLY